MDPGTVLSIASLLSIVFITLHVTDDVVHGFDTVSPWSLIAITVAGVWLYASLLLKERLAGYIIMLLGGVFSFGMPLIHFRSSRIGETVTSSGGFFFLWTLFVLGILGIFTIILCAIGIWNLRSRPQGEGSE